MTMALHEMTEYVVYWFQNTPFFYSNGIYEKSAIICSIDESIHLSNVVEMLYFGKLLQLTVAIYMYVPTVT